jgi:hypothetical protein
MELLPEMATAGLLLSLQLGVNCQIGPSTARAGFQPSLSAAQQFHHYE